MTIIIVILILLIVLFALYLYKQYEANKTLWQIQKETERLKQERIDWQVKESADWENQKLEIKQQITKYNEKKNRVLESLKYQQARLDNLCQTEKERIQDEINKYKNTTNYAAEQYVSALERKYQKIERDYDAGIAELKTQKQQVEDELGKLSESLSAGIAAQQREREKEEKLDFYKLAVTPADEEDIKRLEAFKLSLHQPVVLSKFIWTVYFQKQTTEMCNRIFGKEPVCGIYKITDLKTKQYYIGQSVSIQDRVKQHIKCGCGIDAPATNKLYKAMQKDSVWNFTFELLEECPREQLNEKEKQWISMYQADVYGLNSTKGGS